MVQTIAKDSTEIVRENYGKKPQQRKATPLLPEQIHLKPKMD